MRETLMSSIRGSLKLRAWLGVLSVAVACLVLTFTAAPLFAESIEEAIDNARIKHRAGKTEEAVADLTELLKDHSDDPRVQYYRAKFLKDLKRLNDAADAIEVATATMEAYEKGGGNDAAVLAIKADLKTEATFLLKYRVEARKILADYQTQSLALAAKLLEEKKPLQAAYVLDELAGAVGENGPGFADMRAKVNEALRAEQDAAKPQNPDNKNEKKEEK